MRRRVILVYIQGPPMFVYRYKGDRKNIIIYRVANCNLCNPGRIIKHRIRLLRAPTVIYWQWLRTRVVPYPRRIIISDKR